MSNLGYIVAAYAMTLGALAVYGLCLWRQLRQAERDVAALTGGEGESHAHK
jgi:uncharacterized iron-regulated membrane protein